MLFRVRPIGIIIIFLLTLITLSLYYLAKPVGFDWSNNPLQIISQILSLLGTVYLSLSFVLAARFTFLEKIFGGLDVVYKIHHILGAISFIALLHHPLLLAVNKLPNAELALRYLIPGTNLAFNFGIASLALMIFLLICTFFIKLPYHIWKNLHNWMGGVLFLAMFHIFFITSDVSRFLPLEIWIFSIMSVAAISFILKRFFQNFYKNSYKYVVKNIQTVNDFVKLELSPVDPNRILKYKSGQFVFLSTKSLVVGKETHPFSVASAPHDSNIILYCKKLGDYTKRLELLEKDEVVSLLGPYGTFLETLPMRKNVVGIAGGIGITPFLSLLNDQASLEGKNFNLIHVVRHRNESLLTESSLNLPNCNLYIHESSSQGRFSVQNLDEIIEDLKEVTFYLCGPLGMMESLRTQLLQKGVRPSKIVFEDFAFT